VLQAVTTCKKMAKFVAHILFNTLYICRQKTSLQEKGYMYM